LEELRSFQGKALTMGVESRKKIVHYSPTRLTRNRKQKLLETPRKDGKSIGQAV
jgi:hypothetical protein